VLSAEIVTVAVSETFVSTWLVAFTWQVAGFGICKGAEKIPAVEMVPHPTSSTIHAIAVSDVPDSVT
jgi:hypothetical protein